MEQFPRTTVGGVSLPRMLIGTNWLLGWSHTGAAADAAIRDKFAKPEDFWPVFAVFLSAGVDAVMAPISTTPIAEAAIDYAESYQHREPEYYDVNAMPAATRQAVLLLASHFYESRDGGTGGFFSDLFRGAGMKNAPGLPESCSKAAHLAKGSGGVN